MNILDFTQVDFEEQVEAIRCEYLRRALANHKVKDTGQEMPYLEPQPIQDAAGQFQNLLLFQAKAAIATCRQLGWSLE